MGSADAIVVLGSDVDRFVSDLAAQQQLGLLSNRRNPLTLIVILLLLHVI